MNNENRTHQTLEERNSSKALWCPQLSISQFSSLPSFGSECASIVKCVAGVSFSKGQKVIFWDDDHKSSQFQWPSRTNHHSCSRRWTFHDLSSRSLDDHEPRVASRNNGGPVEPHRGGMSKNLSSSLPGTWGEERVLENCPDVEKGDVTWKHM